MNVASPVGLVLAVIGFAVLLAFFIGSFSTGVDFPPVDATDFFTPGQIERAQSFRGQIRTIALVGTVIGLAALVLLALWRGSPVRQVIAVGDRRPLLAGAILGGLVGLISTLVSIPFQVAAWSVGSDRGLIRQGLGDLFVDQLVAGSITVLLAALGGTLVTLLWRRAGSRFWLLASGVLWVFAAVWLWLWPVLVAPLFDRTTELPEGATRKVVERVLAREETGIAEIFVAGTGARSRAINAWVTGLGPSRRMVLTDTAVNSLPPDQLAVLAAHEAAHVESRDPERGLLFVLLVIPPAMLVAQVLLTRFLRNRGDAPDSPVVVLPAAAILATAVFLLSIPGAVLSRQIEAAADLRALEVTGDPAAAIMLQRRLTLRNLVDPDPPEPWRTLFGTHPAAVERMALAADWKGVR